jgi:sarcosine oxidase/L-pipecolate oxidase
MFVLDFIPEKYLAGGAKDSVAVFTAGWAMKFVPLLGRALKEMVLDGKSDFARPEFAITRGDSRIIIDGPVAIDKTEDTAQVAFSSVMTPQKQKGGSSLRRMGH